MKKLIATVLSVAAISAVYGQGTIATLSNNAGAKIFPILAPDGSNATGANYSVEVFVYDPASADHFGAQLTGSNGTVASPGANARFNLGSATVPNAPVGSKATLIVRAWDNTTGASYAAATVKGVSASFVTDVLGGTPAEGLPITPKSMTTGLADGFQSFKLGGTPVVPEPTTVALGALGAAALFIRRRK